MPEISDRYSVQAPSAVVASFHFSPGAMARLTPPPIVVRMKRADPLAEGSVSEFSLWFGPIPVHWRAVHAMVDPAAGFIDTQTSGPMAFWRHTHRWSMPVEGLTEMEEKIEYEHHPGLRGLPTRLLFARPLLRMMLLYRRWVIRRACRGQKP